MKKHFNCAALAVMVTLAGFPAPAFAAQKADYSATAANQSISEEKAAWLNLVKAELDATAGYISKSMKSSYDFIDYNYFKEYLLILKSGNRDASLEKVLFDYLDNHFNEEGPMNFSDSTTFYPNTWYPYIITFLNETGKNPASYNGVNFCRLFENSYLAENSSTNLYMYSYITDMVSLNPSAYERADEIIKVAQDAVLDSYVDNESGTGIDYFGVSADNNGQCLPALKYVYSKDKAVKAKVDATLAWTAKQFNEKTYAIVSWEADNVDSTALAMKAFSTYNDLKNATKAYHGLLKFKSDTPGSYLYPDYNTGELTDNLYATLDALDGLASYYKALKDAAINPDIFDFSAIQNTKTEKIVKSTQSKDGSYYIVTRCSLCNDIIYSKKVTLKKISSIELSQTAFLYNKKIQKPKVSIKDSSGKILKNGTDYTLKYSANSKNAGSYSVNVTFKGNYSGTKKLNFTIYSVDSPTKPKASANKSSANISWKKSSSKVTGYKIIVAKNNKFTKGLKKYSVTNNSCRISKLSKNTKYYVRIQSYRTVKNNGKNTRLYSGWTKTISFKTSK